MARSQTYPEAIYATYGFHYNNQVAANTGPGVVAFSPGNQEALLIWCGSGGHVQTAIQEYVGYAGTVNTTSIPCTGAGGTGRISVTQYTPSGGAPTFYAIGQPLNNGYDTEFTMISSTDGINWTSYQANVTCGGSPDSSLYQGFGLSTFTHNVGGTPTTQLVLAYSTTCGGGGGPSVAVSTDGVNFAWQAAVSSNTMYDHTSPWFESPAVLQCPVLGFLIVMQCFLLTTMLFGLGHSRIMARAISGWPARLMERTLDMPMAANTQMPIIKEELLQLRLLQQRCKGTSF
jgi:hypothetical protein